MIDQTSSVRLIPTSDLRKLHRLLVAVAALQLIGLAVSIINIQR